MKKIFNEKLLHRLILLFIFIQPLIDMDYLVFEWLDRFGLPRFSTVIRFIILPLAGTLVILAAGEKQEADLFHCAVLRRGVPDLLCPACQTGRRAVRTVMADG